MQSSLLLRSRGLSLAKCPSLSIARTSARAMGSYATFKVPRIDNEPNVSKTIASHSIPCQTR